MPEYFFTIYDAGRASLSLELDRDLVGDPSACLEVARLEVGLVADAEGAGCRVDRDDRLGDGAA